MFTLRFADQGTGAFANLMSFMCFASEIGSVRILEPFVIGSRLGLNVSANLQKELRFSDLFDSRVVRTFTKSKMFGTLASFDEFMQDAPRKLLVAQYECGRCKIPCGHEDALEQGRIFAERNGFEMVGQVCLKTPKNGKTSLNEVLHQLYSDYDKSELVVLFIDFGGLNRDTTRNARFYISLPSCYRFQFVSQSTNRPSELVSESAMNYIQMHLNGKKYITVMVRLEKILGKNKNLESGKNMTKHCLDNLHNRLKKIMSTVGIRKLFVCLDVGRYGSDNMNHDYIVDPLLPYLNQFLSNTVGMTLSEVDNTFRNTTLRENPGFVAMMQKVIAARGDVLVVVGTKSSFHGSTLNLYNSMHKEKKVFTLGDSCS
jgi:hypothetical protein